MELADGGAAGSGIEELSRTPGALPSRSSGTSAWQQALKMGMESNAKKRRN